MGEPELKGAVERLTEARQAATDHGMRNVIMSTADCDLFLQALQQRSGAVERADLVQAVIRATEDGDHHPHISQWAAEQAVKTVVDALQRQQDMPGREEIARIMEPWGPPEPGRGPVTMRRWEAALTKADAILALWNKP